ncbi:hypothetical protein AHAS_Ahas03G0156900 [Arachis hypogaea]
MENSLNPRLARSKIMVCDQKSSPKVAKGLVVKKAGGVGMIIVNGISNGEGLVGNAHFIPTCAVDADERNMIKSHISSTANPTTNLLVSASLRLRPMLLDLQVLIQIPGESNLTLHLTFVYVLFCFCFILLLLPLNWFYFCSLIMLIFLLY